MIWAVTHGTCFYNFRDILEDIASQLSREFMETCHVGLLNVLANKKRQLQHWIYKI